MKNIFGHLPFHLPCLWGAVLHSTLGVSKVRMSSFFWWGAWTSPSKVQTSRGNLHLSESDWGEFLLKFDLGPHVASLVMSTPLCVKLFLFWGGGCASFGMKLQGPLPRPLISGALCSNKASSSKVQTSRGNSHLSESDWGEFLLKFDLGPHVASLVVSTPLFAKLFMCGAGGAQVSG